MFVITSGRALGRKLVIIFLLGTRFFYIYIPFSTKLLISSYFNRIFEPRKYNSQASKCLTSEKYQPQNKFDINHLSASRRNFHRYKLSCQRASRLYFVVHHQIVLKIYLFIVSIVKHYNPAVLDEWLGIPPRL